MKTFLAIGDLHFPWACLESLMKVYAFAQKTQPDYIIQMGDIYDMYSYGRFPRTHCLLTPREEITSGRKMAEAFWKELQRVSPFSICHQLKGNHDERPVKRLLDKAPEFEPFFDLISIFEFDNVTTQVNAREELVIQDIVFMHGYRKMGDHVKHNHKNTVCGHTHRGVCIFIRLGEKTLWELNAGFLADVSSIPMSYTQQRKFAQYTKGIGWIDNFGPRFIPL